MPDIKLLPKNFFKKNPLNPTSAYNIACYLLDPDIRDPYARSMACVVFGMHDCEEMIPMLLREYERFRKDYPDEEYEQGPLLALYQLYGMLD